MEDNTETNNSAFNEASFKMKRLHELQDRINLLRRNLFTPIPTKYGTYGFREAYDCLLGLYQEIAAKCSEDERKEIKEKKDKLRKQVRELEERFDRYKKKDRGIALKIKEYETSRQQLQYDVEDKLFEIEELIRDLLDKHGFSTLNTENLEGDSYN